MHALPQCPWKTNKADSGLDRESDHLLEQILQSQAVETQVSLLNNIHDYSLSQNNIPWPKWVFTPQISIFWKDFDLTWFAAVQSLGFPMSGQIHYPIQYWPLYVADSGSFKLRANILQMWHP